MQACLIYLDFLAFAFVPKNFCHWSELERKRGGRKFFQPDFCLYDFFVSSVEEGENRGESSAPFGIMAALKDLSYTLSLSFSLSYKLTHTHALSHTHTLSLHLNTGPGGVRLLRLNQTNSISSFESFLRLPRFQHQHFRLKSRLPGAAAAAAAARGRLLPPDCPTGPPTTFRAETTTKADVTTRKNKKNERRRQKNYDEDFFLHEMADDQFREREVRGGMGPKKWDWAYPELLA